jgi:hypothetical protein
MKRSLLLISSIVCTSALALVSNHKLDIQAPNLDSIFLDKSLSNRGDNDLIFKASFEQAPVIAYTSFEEPVIDPLNNNTAQYLDVDPLGPGVAHDLVNNPGQTPVDVIGAFPILGVDARYVPYTSPSNGLTDGDYVGVTDFIDEMNIGFAAYPDGDQGYQMQDADGIMVLEFDVVDLTSNTNNSLSLNYFIQGFENWEYDGDIDSSATDSIRIYVKDLTNITEIIILDTTGTDVDSLGFDGIGQWITGNVSIPNNIMMQLVVELRSNGSNEALFLDNVIVRGE